MSNTLLLKRSGTANAVPASGNLALGELAINYTDGNLFYKDGGGTVKVIASNQFSSVVGNVTVKEEDISALSDAKFIEYYSNSTIGEHFFNISKDPRAYNNKRDAKEEQIKAEIVYASTGAVPLDLENLTTTSFFEGLVNSFKF